MGKYTSSKCLLKSLIRKGTKGRMSDKTLVLRLCLKVQNRIRVTRFILSDISMFKCNQYLSRLHCMS